MRRGADEYDHTSVYGVSETFYNAEKGQTASGDQLEEGRFLSYVDVERDQKVCVIGSYLNEDMFGGDGLGQTLTVGGIPYKIIGTLAQKADSTEGSGDDLIYLPYGMVEQLNAASGGMGMKMYLVTSTTKETSSAAKGVVESLLFRIYQDENAYMVMTSAEMMDMMDSMLGVLMTILVVIAAISLVVGGIGIMNIMLVSVTERTREIGIRKSLGAKGRDIRSQFIIEAVSIFTSRRRRKAMKQRLLAGLLAVVLVLGLAPAALAAAPAEEEAAQVLAALDIMVGDESGNLNLGATVTRAEFTKLAVAASTSRDAVGDTVSVKPYPDVPQSHWAAPYIKAAVDLGLVQGDLHGNFNPGRSITLAEGVTIVLRLLGYQDSDFTGVWPSGQMAQYRALKLNEGVTAGQDSAMTRRDALYLFYNLMITKNKEGSYYLNVLEPTLSLVNAAGELDRVALINSAMEGPVVAAAGWQSSVPFDAGSATVYRNGSKSSLAAVQNQDVVYWSESMHTLWAYSDKVTGTIQALEPSASKPTSVTVSGRTCSIETSSAAYALSDLGGYQIGDSVTLLLGRSGGVAAVGEAVAADNLIYGVVTKVESTSYDDGKGGTYNARTVTVAGTDGGSYRYQTDNKSLDEGDLVRVNTDGDTIEVKRLTTSTLTGKMSNDGTKLGTYPLADDVQILDTYESCTPIRIYPDRLKGVKFDGNMVRFYALNAQGEISHLILNDVTGDLHQYGVITSVEELDLGTMMGISSSYTYDVGGQKLTFGSTNAIYNLKVGPCQIKMEGPNAVERLYNLSERKLDSVSGSTAVGTNNQKYTLSDNVAVYVYEGGEYQLSSLARISGGNYSLTGWYDKDESAGGRIRVIIAR